MKQITFWESLIRGLTIPKKEKKKRNKMLKLQTPKQKMKFSKNQPRYNNLRIR